jgi:serine/threonine protein phosphatase PrpC
MGYCYTRDSGLFALADGMGGHPEGEVASQLALQTLAALFQRDAKPTLKEPMRFLHEPSSPATIIAALRHRAGLIDTPRTTIVACCAAGQQRLLGTLRRLAAVPRSRRQADGTYARPLLFRTAGDHESRRAHGRALQPQRVVHLPGQPGKPVVDTVGRWCCKRRPLLLCSDGLWGTVTDAEITDQLASEHHCRRRA